MNENAKKIGLIGAIVVAVGVLAYFLMSAGPEPSQRNMEVVGTMDIENRAAAAGVETKRPVDVAPTPGKGDFVVSEGMEGMTSEPIPNAR
ncbi:MAG: hypothetical protein KDC26_08245 [Armatimonadetes bacterium]|nr:hypothetical protein [Armatimonadota bacterium]